MFTPAMIIAAIDGIIALMGLVTKVTASAKRKTEWTKEEEQAVDAKIASIGTAPWDQDTGK